MEVGDWLRAGCTLPIIFALAWSMFTILRHECGSGQQERSCRQLRKLVGPVWLNASFEASQQAETRSERPDFRPRPSRRGHDYRTVPSCLVREPADPARWACGTESHTAMTGCEFTRQ